MDVFHESAIGNMYWSMRRHGSIPYKMDITIFCYCFHSSHSTEDQMMVFCFALIEYDNVITYINTSH